MNYRPIVRAVLICSIYFGVAMAVELLTKSFSTGAGVGLFQTPGVALGLMVLFGPRYAPMAFATQLFSSFFLSQPAPAFWIQLELAGATTVTYAVTAWLVRRKLGPAPIPENSREATALAGAAVAAPLATALIATALLQAAGFIDPTAFWKSSLVRRIGGVAGVLSAVPVLSLHVAPWVLPGRRRPALARSAREKLEIAAEGIAILVTLGLVYVAAPLRTHHVFFIAFVPLAWIGLRHGLAGTTLTTLVLNLGSFITLRMTGAPESAIADFFVFEVAFAAVGLGLGAAVDFRNCAETALAESRARLARVLAGARLSMWDCDLQTGRVTYDQAWAEMTGYRLEDIPTQAGWWETQVHPDDRPRIEGLLEDHLAGRTPFYEAEFRFQTRQGAWKWIQARGSVTARDASGKALRHAGTQLDLTGRKQAEADQSRLLEIIEASSDFIGSADLEQHALYANPAFLRLRGVPDLATARGMRVADFHPAWAAKKIIEEALPAVIEHGSWIGETALINAAGREIPVSQLIIAQRDDAGRPVSFSTIARDISKQKEIENARLATERTMLQAQKLESLGVLAGGIAHDFNNLLTVVLGNVSLAQLDLPADAPANGYLQQTRTAVVRATELCRQMLAYAGKGQFATVLVNLSALVEDTTQLLKVSITKKCVLKFDLDRDLPSVRVDATQIRQIVMNLVINASDAIGDRSGVIHVSTGQLRADAAYLAETSHEAGLPPGDFVTLEVSDNGSGMTPEVKARVFEPFFTTKFAGRGLGLAAVLGIVRSHGGALRVASEPGRGSTFTLLLPAEKGAAASSPAPSPAIGEGAPGQGTILVVDDETTVRVVAARLLESHGYTTVLATDGRAALRIFKERGSEFRAVLLDLTMPHLSGEETFRELRLLRPDVPVVLMSGFSERDSIGRFPERNRTAFVAKPFDREILIARIREVVEKRAG